MGDGSRRYRDLCKVGVLQGAKRLRRAALTLAHAHWGHLACLVSRLVSISLLANGDGALMSASVRKSSVCVELSCLQAASVWRPEPDDKSPFSLKAGKMRWALGVQIKTNAYELGQAWKLTLSSVCTLPEGLSTHPNSNHFLLLRESWKRPFCCHESVLQDSLGYSQHLGLVTFKKLWPRET